MLSGLLLALRAIRRNALRASLTVLGILIGVMAVCIVTAIGTGASENVGGQISNLGSNVIIVFPTAANASGARGQQGLGARLTIDDGEAIGREATSVKLWAPVMRAPIQAVYEGRSVASNAIGSTAAYLEVRSWKLARGEVWPLSSETLKEKVCVLGSTLATNLFGPLDPVGRRLRIGRHTFQVLGVLETKGQAPFGGDQDDVALMPLGTYKSHVSYAPPDRAGAIMMSATSAETTERAVAQTTSILRQRHRIDEGKEPDFVVRSQAEFQAAQRAITGSLTVLLLAVAAVSLVVGGIGVMNIMLVSVAERTREIGVRMAIGAREGDILVQFLIEAVVLSLIGGVAGIVLSVLVAWALARASGWPIRVQGSAMLIAVATSTAIGVVFGFFPARRAARLDPIQALGRE
ncbi:MAG: ABC transporter permease [Polyangiaceae bacterium]|nr:ABC transporter permease [Polyangiaceae bacterium]